MAGKESLMNKPSARVIALMVVTFGGLSLLCAQSDKGPSIAVAEHNKSAAVADPSRSRAQTPAKAPADSDDYLIGPEDILSVVVWKEKELSATVPVRSDGKISIPLVNDIQAGGFTTLQLRQEIAQRLSKFLDAPEVTVMVTEVKSKRVSIMGEVEKPGMYPLHGPKSLLQLISEAGGFRPFASRKKITVMRNGSTPPARFQINYNELINGSTKADIPLRSGDIVVVP